MRRVSLTIVIGMVTLLVVGCATGRQRVTAACATCIFDMKGVTGCKLAVKIDGRPYLVEGSGIDDHGDAHAADGLCNAPRRAIVVGKVEGDRFVAKKVELLRADE